MSTQVQIREALEGFARRFAAEPRMKAMTAGWDRTIEIRATDLATTERLRVEGGWLKVLPPDEPPGPAEIVMEARSELLCDLFSGRIGPTEPYLSGELILRASEEDVMRIDVLTLMLWEE
jgi:putative sterol carrier protein